MKTELHKTIRPTKLQPQLFSLIKELSQKNDYRVIVDKDNEPVCVLISYQLLQNIDIQKSFDEKKLEQEVEHYYADIPESELELIDCALDDEIN